ncbi:YkvA family protein [Phycisphaerales bacterium AB-hyl4]|uniref:YkvA family protein n=1 Tax=Natronomicrosphaera hydrolytica TaxID=3242702 RepID=A0ABV4U7Z6_9BACT
MAKFRPKLGLFARLKLFWLIYRDPRTPWWAKVILTALALAYVIWPWDAIPIVVPVLGIVDDIVVATTLMWLITRAAPAIVRKQSRMKLEHEQNAEAQADAASSPGEQHS